MRKRKGSPKGDKDRNRIRQQWPRMSLAEKTQYIASYYGVAIGIGILAVFAVVFLVRDICEKKAERAFYVMVIDWELPEGRNLAMEQELAQALGLNPDTQRCMIEAGYSSGANMQNEATISTYMRSGQVDLVLAPEEEFHRYAATGYLAPLEDAGLQEMEESYATERLFYAEPVDYSQPGAVREISFHPHEATENSRCYGIYLTQGVFQGCVIGVMANCPNPERIEAGARYFLELP